MTPEDLEAAADQLLEQRRAQGLPDGVTDPIALDRLAYLLRPRDEGGRSSSDARPAARPGGARVPRTSRS